MGEHSIQLGCVRHVLTQHSEAHNVLNKVTIQQSKYRGNLEAVYFAVATLNMNKRIIRCHFGSPAVKRVGPVTEGRRLGEKSVNVLLSKTLNPNFSCKWLWIRAAAK